MHRQQHQSPWKPGQHTVRHGHHGRADGHHAEHKEKLKQKHDAETHRAVNAKIPDSDDERERAEKEREAMEAATAALQDAPLNGQQPGNLPAGAAPAASSASVEVPPSGVQQVRKEGDDAMEFEDAEDGKGAEAGGQDKHHNSDNDSVNGVVLGIREREYVEFNIPEGRELMTCATPHEQGKHLPEPLAIPYGQTKRHHSSHLNIITAKEVDTFIAHAEDSADLAVKHMSKASSSDIQQGQAGLVLAAHLDDQLQTMRSRQHAFEKYCEAAALNTMILTSVSRTNHQRVLELEAWLWQHFSDEIVAIDRMVPGQPASSWLLRTRGTTAMSELQRKWHALPDYPAELARTRMVALSSWSSRIKEFVRRSLVRSYGHTAEQQGSTLRPLAECLKDGRFLSIRSLDNTIDVHAHARMLPDAACCEVFIRLLPVDYTIFRQEFVLSMTELCGVARGADLPIVLEFFRISTRMYWPCLKPRQWAHPATAQQQLQQQQPGAVRQQKGGKGKGKNKAGGGVKGKSKTAGGKGKGGAKHPHPIGTGAAG